MVFKYFITLLTGYVAAIQASPQLRLARDVDDLPTIKTTSGYVKGASSPFRSNVTIYKGIPFAALPIDDLRWKAPQPPQSWSGVKNATVFGPQCAQSISPAGIFSSGKNTASENCLYLNIWTPSYHDVDNFQSQNLPVYFWIYGRRFSGGSGDVITYDGTGLASKGIIVVTINYRLGPFGFLAHPELDAESGAHNASGNYGILDQQAALRWVHDNIAAFGGNPKQIVAGGQSAGSASALDTMWSPLTEGLVAGVIAESGARGPRDPLTGSLATSYRNKTDALQQGVKFLGEDLNVSSIAAARNLSMSVLLEFDSESEKLFEDTASENITAAFMDPPLWRPVIDGYVLTHGYGELLALNAHADVPILTGNNAEESGASPSPGLNVSQYAQYGEMWQNFSSQFYDLYPGNNSDQANNASNAFFRDLSRVSTWTWAKNWRAGGARNPVYVYYFDHTPAENPTSGAYHGSELWYTFNHIPYSDYSNVSWTAKDYAIEETMSSYWVNFISTGNPNGQNLTDFPASTADNTQVMRLGNAFGVIALARSTERVKLLRSWLNMLFEW